MFFQRRLKRCQRASSLPLRLNRVIVVSCLYPHYKRKYLFIQFVFTFFAAFVFCFISLGVYLKINDVLFRRPHFDCSLPLNLFTHTSIISLWLNKSTGRGVAPLVALFGKFDRAEVYIVKRDDPSVALVSDLNAHIDIIAVTLLS